MDEGNQQATAMDSEAVLENRDISAPLIEFAKNKSEEPSQKKTNEDVLNCELEEANTLSTNGVDNLVENHSDIECEISNCESKIYKKSSQPDQNMIQIQKKSSSENPNKVFTEVSTLRDQSEVDSECVGSSNETNKSINLEKDFSFVYNSNVINSNINKINENESTVIIKNSQEELNNENKVLKEDFCEDLKKKEENEFTSLDVCKTQNSILLEINDKDCTMKEDVKDDFNFEEEILSPDKGEGLKVEDKQIGVERNIDSNEPNEAKSEEIKEVDLKSEANSCAEVKNSNDSGTVTAMLPECIGDTNEKTEILIDSLGYKSNKTTNHELEKKSEELSIKSDCLSDQNNSNLSISNTSTDQSAENLSKSENDGIEIMDTEVVNCNEIELVDLNENELQKDKEIDRIGSDSSELESKSEQKAEEVLEDMLENSYNEEGKGVACSPNNENPKEVLSFQEDIHHPENSEEETITGDTGNITTTNVQNNKDKDEDVCIIPDDMTSGLSILSKKELKNNSKRNESEKIENSDLKVIQVKSPEPEKTKSSNNEKKLEEIDNLKSRPIRNAAKLAENKIRSLVLNDLVFEEQASGGNVKGESSMHVNSEESLRMCAQCREVKLWKFLMVHGDTNQYLCSEQCSEAFAKNCQTETDTPEIETTVGEFIRKCAQCHAQIIIDDKCLFWETMDFCNEDCLGKYQTKLGSNCANCKGNVFQSSLGKYCVRFGYDVKQFCSSACLEEYKKGLKVCSYCQKDISTGAEGFLAPVGNKGQFKDFCTQSCMEKYEQMSSNAPQPDVIEECAVCSNSKAVRVEVKLDNKTHKLCSKPCFAAFKFVNNITEGQCDMCRKYFDRAKTENFAVFYDETPRCFCCKTCMNVYILANRKIVPCSWCKVKKYNFDMIKKGSASGQLSMMCSLNCLTLYQLSMNTVCSRRVKCDFCLSLAQTQYHLTMSDATTRNFCSYACAMSFQNQYPKQGVDIISGTDQLDSPIPMGVPRRVTPRRSQVESPCVPVISSVQSLASSNDTASPPGRFSIPRADVVTQVNPISQSMTLPPTVAPMPAPPPQIYQQIITKPPPSKQMKNKSVLCKPYSHTKGVSCRPHPCVKETQTDQSLNRKFLIPIPVPIYVPAPMHMFATPFPVPVPFPLPVPVPIFIPTTRNSAKGIFKEIKKIQEKIPTDPFEAELLMMAEMVAGEKKQDPTDSESEEGNDGEDGGDGTFSPENVDANNTFGEDMLQMALKMASELEEPAVDMESVLTSNTITTSTQPSVDPNKTLYASTPDNPDQVHVMSMNRGRKRSVRGSRNSTGGTPSKRGRRTSGSVDVPLLPPPEPVPPPRIEVEKPDANMCLKYTFGVNAWRHWVMQKNAELEKAAMTNRKIKLFKPELLQLTADELNFSLCLFVKEVRKPNGTEYAPDTIYYLCLGIQQYLFENGRIDNIFTDSYYEKFTDCLDEVAKKFAALYNDSQYIVTRVEEEHLWESKQLGAHSPHVLLSTLMFFNTKHFNLVTVEEHMQLSFSHIMKHWKRNPNTPGVAKVPGSRNVLLRFYPPQSALEANTRKKKVYEQQENEENPLRCPVKLYEFYLSKCPESVKTRNDVFYLLPERSCVPDSPVWYSTMALGKEPLMKMLHRVKMVKEINIALLTC